MSIEKSKSNRIRAQTLLFNTQIDITSEPKRNIPTQKKPLDFRKLFNSIHRELAYKKPSTARPHKSSLAKVNLTKNPESISQKRLGNSIDISNPAPQLQFRANHIRSPNQSGIISKFNPVTVSETLMKKPAATSRDNSPRK